MNNTNLKGYIKAGVAFVSFASEMGISILNDEKILEWNNCESLYNKTLISIEESRTPPVKRLTLYPNSIFNNNTTIVVGAVSRLVLDCSFLIT